MKIVETQCRNCSVRGVRVYEMRHVVDPVRGHLTAGEFGRDLPFVPQRFFITFGIPTMQTRGEHAHLLCEQFLVCVHGRCCVQVDDGQHSEQITLNHPSLGIYVPPMVWAAEFKHEPGSALMVFASRPYEPEDYIRGYEEFLSLVKGKRPQCLPSA